MKLFDVSVEEVERILPRTVGVGSLLSTELCRPQQWSNTRAGQHVVKGRVLLDVLNANRQRLDGCLALYKQAKVRGCETHQCAPGPHWS